MRSRVARWAARRVYGGPSRCPSLRRRPRGGGSQPASSCGSCHSRAGSQPCRPDMRRGASCLASLPAAARRAPGAAAAIATPPAEAGAARRLAIAGAPLELAATKATEMRLGQLLGEQNRQGAAARFTRLAKGCTEQVRGSLRSEGEGAPARRSGADCSLPGRCSSPWPSTEPALSRPPTRSTPLCHNASAPRASAAKRRRVLPES